MGSRPAGPAAGTDVDGVARALLHDLLDLPDVTRAGVALVEGGGRRLRFLVFSAERPWGDWCHIDAYDDVPLTSVVRDGRPVIGSVDGFGGRFAGLLEAHPGTRALAALALPGDDGPLGGFIVYYDQAQGFDAAQAGRLDALARQAGAAVRQVRARRVVADRQAVVNGAEPSSVRTASLPLAADRRAAGMARKFLRGALSAWGVEEEPAETAELCLSELVTNAVIHGGATSQVRIGLDGDLLTVAVRDHGGPATAGPPGVVDDEDPMRVFGRGLVLVEALSDRWGAEQDAVGTTAWFVLELGAEPEPVAG